MIIRTATDELHDLYKKLNKEFFNGDLPEIALTIQSKGNHKLSMGWFTPAKMWSDAEGKTQLHEINITAEYLNLSVTETVDTLMHEMVHLWNYVRGIKDTSRGNTYHNVKFKEASIGAGFYYTSDKPDKKYGWSFSKLAPETMERIRKLGINETAFAIGRREFERQKCSTLNEATGLSESGNEGESAKKQTSWRLVCPVCEMKLRASKQGLKVKCVECDEELIEV